MKLLLLDDLENEGLSHSEVKRSLIINCFAKTFRRKCDLPKKFKEKAISLCEEIMTKGKECFVIDTNYSYTVWVEEDSVMEDKKIDVSNNINEILIKKIDNKLNNLSLPTSVENDTDLEEKISYVEEEENIDYKTTFVEEKYNLFEYISQDKLFSYSEKNRRQNHKDNSLLPEVSEEVQKYRGLVINPSVITEEKTPSKSKTKPKTYRGVAY